MKSIKGRILVLLPVVALYSCGDSSSIPSGERIDELHLKKGEVIVCGPAVAEFGTLDFAIAGNGQVRQEFNIAVELLHSFEYDESEKVFAKIIDESPDCAMAYWGIAMCNFHPLWEPPTEAELKKGSAAIAIAKSIRQRSERASAYIDAVAAYYQDWKETDLHTRAVHFEKAMEALHARYPGDPEAAIFYALALDAAADPADKSYINQRKAGELLNRLYGTSPNHPGIIHYLIHTYDYPGIAELALPAARRYARVAPSSAHALHMPSHIFTRLGLWDDCIQSNTRSVDAARCYAQAAGLKGHWDEELHGLDYLIYAYLQKGDNSAAGEQLKYLATIGDTYPENFKVAYTFAASPCRAALENRDWEKAAGLPLQPASFPWERFPWQEAIVHFGRLLGSTHSGDMPAAETELSRLNVLYDMLRLQHDAYKSKQVAIQITAGEAWIASRKGEPSKALRLMEKAADMEDSTSKHPVTPGEVLPARELYADLLLEMHQDAVALQAYESVLQKSPNRFNSLYGAGVCSEKAGDRAKAARYYRQLVSIAEAASNRKELIVARAFLKRYRAG